MDIPHSLSVPTGPFIDQAQIILDYVAVIWHRGICGPQTLHSLHRWFNHFAFVLFDPDIAATTPLYGWQFLTSDFNLEYLISRYLKFDPANCGSRVFVGPGRTQSVCPHGMMIWIQIPSLVLKAAMQALLSAPNPMAPKNFVIQVMCWDGEYHQVLQNMVSIWRTCLPAERVDLWVLTFEVSNIPLGSGICPFFDNLLHVPFNVLLLNFPSLESLQGWVSCPSFNQHSNLDTIHVEFQLDSEDDSDGYEDLLVGALQLLVQLAISKHVILTYSIL
jgi:hypothetical protein